ncbi:hypothetical protein AAGS61_10175 [Lysinibacillus sp. KU-BSD001]|uniref:hypothetical protein n=1 Tax=Lysinibacillus sp. KU-BSD001 TaxID=3141328 RepID=UPI0036E9AD40
MFIQNTNSSSLSSNLFLGNKKPASIYEIKKENGYIRHYVNKPNGEKIMIKETKLPKSQENEYSSSNNLKDVLYNQLMDTKNLKEVLNTGITGQKAKQKIISVYQNSI